MDDRDLFVVYENGEGRRLYQPRLENGERARWATKMGSHKTVVVWNRGTSHRPVLCRSRAEAIWIARKETKKRRKAELSQYKEVSDVVDE